MDGVKLINSSDHSMQSDYSAMIYVKSQAAGVGRNQGSHMFSKPSNVLEFELSVRVPSNVLEFKSMFSNVLETNCL